LPIRNKRTERIIRDIIYGYLADGQYPTLDIVLRDLARRQEEIGFKMSPISNKGIVTSDPVNKAMDRIYDSIQLLYDELDELYVNFKDYFTITRNEYKKIAEWERTLSCKLDDIIHSSSAASAYFHSWGDSFNNLKRIDPNMTTAQLRLESGEAHLHTNLHLSKQLSVNEIRTTSPSVVVDDINYLLRSESTAYLTNAFDGQSNTFWTHDVATSKNMGVTLYLNLTIKDGQINHVDIEPFVLGPTQITVYAVRGNNQIQWGQSITTAGRVSYGGNPEGVTGVVIKFYKDHFDFLEQSAGGTRYIYRFGAGEIVLRKEVYDTSSDVISAAITIPNEAARKYTLSSASIDVDEVIPEGTTIDYFLGAEPSGGATSLEDITWIPVSPSNVARDENVPRTVYFAPGSAVASTVEPDKVFSDPAELDYKTYDEGILDQDVYSSKTYKAVNAPNTDILIDSLVTYVGWGQGLLWRKDSVDPKYSNEYCLGEWQTRSEDDDTYCAYIDAENLGSIYLVEDFSYLAEYMVETEAATSIVTSFYKPSEWTVNIFLNGTYIAPISTGRTTYEMSLTLERGKNWLHIAIIADEVAGYIRLGTELSRVGNVYLWKPLTTDITQLARVSQDDMYASWNNGLYTNFDLSLQPNIEPDIPLTPASGYENASYMPRIYYTYYNKGTSETQIIRFRALLSRSLTAEATPRLREYHVRMKHGG
jgi:hypothetical protein